MSILAGRLSSQLLSGEPAGDPASVARRLLAIQAQDPRGARLAIRVRSSGLSVSDFERALNERALVITWLNRGTLHLVRSEDYPWLAALTCPTIVTANARRLSQEGVTAAEAERGVKVIERSLIGEGALSRRRLCARLEQAGVRTAGQALVHLLMLASLRGSIVRGPMVEGEQAFVFVRDWLGEPPAIERDVALAELARRYLAGHAPADERDLAKWSGLPLRDVRRGLRAIAGELHERADGLLELRNRAILPTPHDRPATPHDRSAMRHDRSALNELPPPRLLGPFDPLLLGWVSRELVTGSHQGLVTVNGLFRPFALVKGKAAAIWRIEKQQLQLDPFVKLSAIVRRALRDDARDLLRYMSG